MRQVVSTDPILHSGLAVATLAKDYPRLSLIPAHAHDCDQLVYASHGVMEVSSANQLWLIPPHFGLWIPAGMSHSVRMPKPVSMRTLYLRPGLWKGTRGCAALHVTPFLRELIVEITRMGCLRPRRPLQRALRDILVAQLDCAARAPTGVSLPRDERALSVAHTVIATPAQRRTLARLCANAGVGVRTLQRIFRRELGMDFESWRRQVRLMKGIELLISGKTVKETAFAVGYRQISTFVDLFRATFGAPPKAWIGELQTQSRRLDVPTSGIAL